MAGALKTSSSELLPKPSKAFIYGSIAKGEDHAGSDVDVMLVGDDLSYSEIMQLLETAETQLQRTINPTIYSVDEFTQRMADNESVLNKVMDQATINLLDEQKQDVQNAK